MSTQSLKETPLKTPKNVTDLYAAYMIAFDEFATDRTAVANEVFDGDKAKASRALNRLRTDGLIASTDVNENAQGSNREGAYSEIVWQCYQTYDSVSREEATAIFDAKYGTTNGEPTTKETAMPTKTATKSNAAKAAAEAAVEADAPNPTRKADTPNPTLDRVKAAHADAKADAKAAKKATPKTKPAAKPAPVAFTWPIKPEKLFSEYLKARVTADADGPNRKQPFITETGVLRVHSTDWVAALTEQGIDAPKSAAAKVLRDAGLSVKSFPLPGEDRAFGFYTGPAPKGTEKLPRRAAAKRAPRAARPFGTLTDVQADVLRHALSSSASGLDAEQRTCRDELLTLLP